MVAQRGLGGKLVLEFEKLHYFGNAKDTRVIYMKLNENSDQYELLKDINHLLV